MYSNSSEQPALSVLIPAYNAGNSIVPAVESVLSQDFENFELIVCNDASIDNTLELLQAFKDERIMLLSNEVNKGIAATRNILLQAASAPYIVWLDADDTMLPGRLQTQWQFMEAHPDIDLASSFVLLANYHKNKRSYPLNPADIKAMMLFKNIMVQPAMVSRNFYKTDNTWYDESCNYIEDYELWSRLMQHKNFGMVPEYLTLYTVPSTEQEHQKRLASGWYANYDRLLKQRLKTYLNIDLDHQQLQILSEFLRTHTKLDKTNYRQILALLNMIRKQASTDSISPRSLETVLLYFQLQAAKRYHIEKAIAFVFKFSPFTWYRVRLLLPRA